ncbi:hypothetical protein L6164_035609 [Bauhinia variegata]|uniref:Uncharacterized protein n=1 Tax=Bauhinia variegata TaxID=167791 RepID=A0ACB9KEJ9_BAUVA|nr:hypothetical protein L6164_035609 [Bauhinia variegata]
MVEAIGKELCLRDGGKSGFIGIPMSTGRERGSFHFADEISKWFIMQFKWSKVFLNDAKNDEGPRILLDSLCLKLRMVIEDNMHATIVIEVLKERKKEQGNKFLFLISSFLPSKF